MNKFTQKFPTIFWSVVTWAGTPLFYLLFAVLLFYQFPFLVLHFLLTMAAVEVVCWTIKLFYRKERPIPKPRTNIFNKIDANSFPSIHVARISAVALYMNFLHQNIFLVIFGVTLVVLVGCSRLFLGRHHATDIFVGMCLGFAIAMSISIFFI